MKSIFWSSHIGQLLAPILLLSLLSCSPAQKSTRSGPAQQEDSTQSSALQSSAKAPISSNLIALFLVRKDNLTQEFQAEVYPIALLLNNRYLEVSEDVTLDARNGVTSERLIQLKNPRIVVNAIQNFTVVSNHQVLGEFQVEKPIVSQFACSSLITGQGNFQEQVPLPAIFERLPPEQSSRFQATIRNQSFDQTWRTAIAISQLNSMPERVAVPETALAQYRQAAAAIGKAAIAQIAQGQSVAAEAAVDSLQVVDLDRDGAPELFAKVRQGKAAGTNASPQPTGFATVWLTYQNGQPQLLETMQAAVSLSGTQQSPSHNLLGTIDVNGDGVDEVITKRVDYEYTGFEIYEYRNNRLHRVFNGAGYGC